MGNYLAFMALVSVVTFAPGPDTFLTLRTTAVSGRAAGLATVLGISLAGATQGLLAVTGLGALIVHAEPVFQAIKWAGVCYLAYLGIQALRSAFRGGQGWDDQSPADPAGRRGTLTRVFWKGFLCNITNPKVLVFNLAVLPQFVGPGSSVPKMLAYALTLTGLGVLFLTFVTFLAGAVAGHLKRPRVRTVLDGSVGAVMLGFAGVLAAEG